MGTSYPKIRPASWRCLQIVYDLRICYKLYRDYDGPIHKDELSNILEILCEGLCLHLHELFICAETVKTKNFELFAVGSFIF